MLTEMEKDFEGYNRAVKAVMHAAEKGTLRGVRGPVANLIKTGDRYALAIETALGAAAQNIVVDTQSCGAQAIELLRRRETGRATFLPLDTIRPMHLNSVPDQEPGYVGVADALVTCAAAYRDIVSNLLGRTVVAETMKDAIAISRRYDHRYRIVTLDGQLVNAGGSLTGGSAAKGSGILSRANELKRLRAALDTLTLEENIMLVMTLHRRGKKEIQKRCRELLRILGIEEVKDKYPYQVSGGQKQRCACARALANYPTLLLADEPTGALDSLAAQTLLETFTEMNKNMGATILMVTHDAFSASYCSRILFLKDGKIFHELVRGGKERRAFLNEILDVMTLTGGERSHDV